MKTIRCFMIVLTMLLSACAPIIPASGESTPVGPTPFEMTAVVSTVIAETPGPPPTEGPSPTPEPPTPIPTLPSSILSPTELKYRVLEQFPDFFFCDPDFYPIAREDEMALAQRRFPELQANQEEFQAILNHNGLGGQTTFTDDQKLLIYREHKKLAAIFFQLVGDRYQFQIQTGMEGQQGSIINGTIDGRGSIEIVQQDPGFPSCPICLAAGTHIDTPQGSVPVEDLQVGSAIWTMSASGERVSGTILRIVRVEVPTTHQIIHIVLSDWRELWASPGHPTADGRALGDLKEDDLLDGARVTLVELLPYEGLATYDLLPSGDTGFYWANGILMGSTLAKP
jgi:hypothetical protein